MSCPKTLNVTAEDPHMLACDGMPIGSRLPWPLMPDCKSFVLGVSLGSPKHLKPCSAEIKCISHCGQGQAASADITSKHYPFDWAVVIAAVSSTATFMLLIVLLLAFASGFLPHRRRRGNPGSPKSLKSAPLAPSGGGGLNPQSQSPQAAAAGRRLSRYCFMLAMR